MLEWWPRARSNRRWRGAQCQALFDQWVEQHLDELYRFAYRACGDALTAEDLVQETFYEAWKHRRPLREVREPRAWLYVILRRRYARLQRQQRRGPRLVPLDGASASVEGEGSDRLANADALQPALDAMSDTFKLPLLMVFVQGMSCAQAAEQLDVPLGTILSRVHRAKKQLRQEIRRQESGPGKDAGSESEPGSADQMPRLRIGDAG